MAASDERVMLPATTFLYTLDQVAALLSIDETTLRKNYVYFDGVTTGRQPRKMIARDISVDGTRRDWRISELEFRRYLRLRGFRVVEIGVR